MKRPHPDQIEHVVCCYVLPALAILYILAIAIIFRRPEP